MADNYLEKQMDDFRSGKLSQSRTKTLGSIAHSLKPGEIFLSSHRVLVAFSDFETTALMVKLFRSTGAKVAFIATPDSAGTALAQASGARFYPIPFTDNTLTEEQATKIIANLNHHWHGLTIITGNLHPFISI